jgi:hypothetical protein
LAGVIATLPLLAAAKGGDPVEDVFSSVALASFSTAFLASASALSLFSRSIFFSSRKSRYLKQDETEYQSF